jgi:hypothetical protein
MSSPIAIETDVEDRKPLRKAVATLAITKASHAIHPVGRKVYNVLLWHAQQNPAARQYSLALATVSRQIEFGSRNYEVLKDACRAMTSTLVEWESPSKGEVSKWSVAPLLAGVDLVQRNGALFIEWSFGHNIQSQLLDPQRFANIRLSSVAKLRTVAGIQLYEICARYQKNPSKVTSRQHWTWWYEVLRAQPGSRSDKPVQYKFFKRDTLVRAVAEVNSATELQIEFEEFKEGRAVKDLQFSVHLKEAAGPAVPPRMPSMSFIDTVARAKLLGLAETAVDALLDAHGEAEVERGLALLEQRLGKPGLERITSAAKWLQAVLDDSAQRGNGIRPSTLTAVIDRSAALRYREDRMAYVWSVYQSMDYEVKEIHKAEFEMEHLQRQSPAYQENWRSQGVAGRLAGPLFKAFLCERLLGPQWHVPDHPGPAQTTR